MRGVRVVIICLLSALALAGCMRRSAPVAVVQPQPDLDSITYGRSHGMAPAPVAYATATVPVRYDAAYHLDAGDKLRVVVYGQEGLTNTYAIDAGGSITMPLIGAVRARGKTPAGLAADISAKLRNGFIREPSVAVEIEAYRPFFILGEVKNPGSYPYVPDMTVLTAVAIAGGFTFRASEDEVSVTRKRNGAAAEARANRASRILPGDVVYVFERHF